MYLRWILNEDGHIVHEPVVLKCGYNACKKCCSDPVASTIKCFSCHNSHDKNELLNAPKNKASDFIIKLFLNDLYQDLNLKLESIKGLDLLLLI